MPTCFITSCKNNERTKIPGLSFHRFPAKMKAEWLVSLGLLPDTRIRRTSVICSNHFQDSDFLRSTNYKFLKEHIVPSVNLPTKEFIAPNSPKSIDFDNTLPKHVIKMDKSINSKETKSSALSFTINESSSNSKLSPEEMETLNMVIQNLHPYCQSTKTPTQKTLIVQYELYLSALEEDPVFKVVEEKLKVSTLGLEESCYLSKKWIVLAAKLNCVKGGPKMPWKNWKRRFATWKLGTKAKYKRMIRGLSNIEAKALYLWGSPEGTNLLRDESEELANFAKTEQYEIDQNSSQYMSTDDHLEINSNLDNLCESSVENGEFKDTNNSDDEIEIKYADLIKNNVTYDENRFPINIVDIKKEFDETTYDFETTRNEINHGILEIKCEDISDVELEEDENILTETTPHIVNGSNFTSEEYQDNDCLLNIPSTAQWEPLSIRQKIEEMFVPGNDSKSVLSKIKKTPGSSQIIKSKNKNGKTIYVQIERIN